MMALSNHLSASEYYVIASSVGAEGGLDGSKCLGIFGPL
jgi:hypothetical protein